LWVLGSTGSVTAVVQEQFFFGAMSPYSWFAAERIGNLIPDAQWCPVFAGGLFAANGRQSWGLDDRRVATIRDCEQRAITHELGVIRWPHGWPSSDILVARAMAFADREVRLQEFALAAMRSAFLHGNALSELTVLQQVAEQVGLDPDELAQAVADPTVKDAIRAVHRQAMSLGVFGIPTVVVGDALFWGDDRLLEAAAASRTVRD
jgi:2-hydroxychromene-2-carboxylate isomerase